MDYYEFLTQKLATIYPQLQQSGFNIQQQSQTNPILLFGDNTHSVKLNGASIFMKATKEEVSKVDYTKIVGKDESSNKDLSPLEFVLKAFFSMDKIKEAADTSKDGKLSEEEVKAYIEKVMSNDNNAQDLSQDDFNKAIKDLGINLEELTDNNQQPEETTQQEIQEPVSQEYLPINDTPVHQSRGVSSNDSVGAGNGDVSQIPAEPTMTLEELETEKVKREGILNEKQKVLASVIKEETSGIKAAKLKKEKAQKEYEAALKHDAGAKKFVKDIINNNKQIEKNKQALNDVTAKIQEKESSIEKQKDTVSDLESDVKDLEDELNGLPKLSGKEEDKEKDAQIEKQRDEVNKKIKDKKSEFTKAQKELEKQNKELEKLNAEKTKLEKEKEQLAQEKKELDAKVEQFCTQDTKDKLAAFNKAAKEFVKVKEKETAKAQKDVDEAKASLKEIKEKIKVAKENKKQQAHHDSSIINASGQKKDLAYWISQGYDPKKGKLLAQETVAQTTDFHSDCAGGVRRGINNAGLGNYKHFKCGQWAGNLLAKNPNFREVSTAGIDPERDLPDGAVLIYNPGVDGYHPTLGHMETKFTAKNGDAKAASDGITNNIRKHPSRIFIPV